MKYGIILCLLSASLIILLWQVLKRRTSVSRKGLFVAVVVVSVLFVALIALIPITHKQQKYSSPENAFHYKNSGEVLFVLEGEHSAYIVSESSSGSYTYDFVARDGKFWVPISGVSARPSIKRQGDIEVHIYRYGDTDDYYITVKSTSGHEIKISDNRDSTFNRAGETYDISGSTFDMYTYFAYIGAVDSTYNLEVNGEIINLL